MLCKGWFTLWPADLISIIVIMTCLGNTHRGHTATKQNISKMKIETNEENHTPGEENSRRKWHHTGGEGYQVEISHILGTAIPAEAVQDVWYIRTFILHLTNLRDHTHKNHNKTSQTVTNTTSPFHKLQLRYIISMPQYPVRAEGLKNL